VKDNLPVKRIKATLKKLGDPEQAKVLQRFFKTGPGEYAEGDIFLGIKAPVIRGIVRQHRDVPVASAANLLSSPIHEERLVALLMLIARYQKTDPRGKEEIYRVYLRNTRYINNWDLVDITAPHIVGTFLMDKTREPLYKLARSSSVWERRIAILSTLHFIRNNEYDDTLKIAEILLGDSHDLIHKAAGWMLREVGKRDISREEAFLKKHCHRMPRTMLRYAIERFPEKKRQGYMKKGGSHE